MFNMINVYVDDLENVVKGRLLSAKEDIKILIEDLQKML